MSKEIRYTNAPRDIARSLKNTTRVSDDFLPSPAELTLRDEKERITIALDKRSLDLFRKYAKEHDAKYQNMINGVIESYASRHFEK